MLDAIRVGNWQRGGAKDSKRPDPIPRPGVKTAGKAALSSSEKAVKLREYAERRRKQQAAREKG